MIVKLFDDTEFYITNQQAQALERELTKSTEGFITIGDRMVKKNAISSIVPGGITEADIPKANDKLKQLQAGKRCRGQYSIQAEINKAAKELGGKDWAKLIQNKAWREKIRNQLRTTPADWCDYKAGECACESDFLSYKARHDRAGVAL